VSNCFDHLLQYDSQKILNSADTLWSEYVQATRIKVMSTIVSGHVELDGCIVWNAHNTVLGEETLLIYIVPVCYVKTGRYGKT